jgi:hypothetical protein
MPLAMGNLQKGVLIVRVATPATRRLGIVSGHGSDFNALLSIRPAATTT